MNDCFALLDEPRRPWLDEEALKQKFLSLSAAFHPDRVHGGNEAEKSAAQKRYTEINAAYNRLRDPKDRLLHLLELERGEKPKDTQNVNADLVDLFTQVNSISQEAARLLVEKNAVTSPLLKVTLFERSQELTDRLLQLQQRVTSQRDAVLARIRELDATWDLVSTREENLAQLENLYRLLSYFTRWNGQLQERIVSLAL